MVRSRRDHHPGVIPMSEFSLALNEDQLQIQKWVHDFAENRSCARPPRSGTRGRSSRGRSSRRRPRSGSTAFDFFANASMADATGLTLPIALEELFWGDAGIGLSIFGSGLAAAGIAGNGTPEQVMEWVPQCFGTPEKIQLGAFCVSEPDAGSDVSSLRTKAVYDEAKDEWVLNGTKAWITNGGIADVHVVVATVDPDAQGPGPGQLRRPARHQGPVAWARSTRSTASGRRTPPRSCSTTCASPAAACSAARRSSTSKLARAQEQQKTGEKQPAMATFEATRPAVGAMADRHRPGRLRVRASTTPRSARRSARRSSRTRPSPSCSPT